MKRSMRRLLKVFLSDVDRRWVGYELMRRTLTWPGFGFGFGSLYPNLSWLEANGWVEGEWTDDGRVFLRRYRLTAKGVSEAQRLVNR